MIHGISKTWLRDIVNLGSAGKIGSQAVVIEMIDLHGCVVLHLISYTEDLAALFANRFSRCQENTLTL